MARRRNPMSAGSLEQHLPLLLLVGGAVAGAYLYGKKKAASMPVLAATLPVPQLTPTLPTAADYTAAMATASQNLPSIDPSANDIDSYLTSPAVVQPLPDTVTISGLGAWRQPSGALPGMGRLATGHSRMAHLRTGAGPRGQLAGFTIAHVFDHSRNAPQMNGLGSFFSSVSNAVKNTVNAVAAAPAKIVTAVAAPIESLTGAGGLKVPLAIATGGASLLLNAGAKAAVGVTNAVTTVVAKALPKVSAGQATQAPTATTDCNGYAIGQVVYQDCNGTTIDCATFMSSLTTLANAGYPSSASPTTSGAVSYFRLPACPPAAVVTPVPVYPVTPVAGTTSATDPTSIASTYQINPATGVAYPAGTPINPYTGAAYINPSTGQPYAPGTVLDAVTGTVMYIGAAPLTATGTINPMTGLPYPTVASPSDPTSVASTTQINPMTGMPYPVGTPINPMTGQAYVNPTTGVAWPPYTVIDQYTGYPIMAINPATGTYYPINTALMSQVSSATPYYGYTGAADAATDTGGGYTDPNVQAQGVDPMTGMPYATPYASQSSGIDPTTGQPYAAAPAAPAAAAAAPVAASKMNWWAAGGIAIAVPVGLYFMHK